MKNFFTALTLAAASTRALTLGLDNTLSLTQTSTNIIEIARQKQSQFRVSC